MGEGCVLAERFRNCSGGHHHQGFPTIRQEKSWSVVHPDPSVERWSFVVSPRELVSPRSPWNNQSNVFSRPSHVHFQKVKGKAKLTFAINRGLNVLLVCMFSGSFESLDSHLVPVFIFASPALQVHVYWRKNVFSSIQQNIEFSYRLYKVTSERHPEMTSLWRSVGLFFLLIDH